MLLVAIALIGVAVVARFHVWADVDERPHYAFVQTIVEDHRLPDIDDVVSPEVQAITDNTWPKPSPNDPAEQGLSGRNYEAFQPPLYYVIAGPAFAVAGDHKTKVFVLRAFDLLLYLAGAALLWVLAGRLGGGESRRPIWCAGLLVLLWPGVLARGITVSNTALEFVVVPAFLLAAWECRLRASARWFAAAALLAVLCVLTKLTQVVLLPLLAAVAFDLWRRRAASAVGLVGAAALAGLLLVPWLLFNHSTYGAWTGNAAARDQQTPVLYPNGVPSWGIEDLPGKFAHLFDGTVPQEWAGQLDVWWVGLLAKVLGVMLVAGIAIAFGSANRTDRRMLAFFTFPAIACLGAMTVTLLVSDWDIFLLRYAAPALAPACMAAALLLSRRWPRALRVGGIAMTVLLALLWVDLAGAYLFTDVGDKLGI